MFFVETAQNLTGNNLAENGACAIDRLVVVLMVVLLVQELHSIDEQAIDWNIVSSSRSIAKNNTNFCAAMAWCS